MESSSGTSSRIVRGPTLPQGYRAANCIGRGCMRYGLEVSLGLLMWLCLSESIGERKGAKKGTLASGCSVPLYDGLGWTQITHMAQKSSRKG